MWPKCSGTSKWTWSKLPILDKIHWHFLPVWQPAVLHFRVPQCEHHVDLVVRRDTYLGPEAFAPVQCNLSEPNVTRANPSRLQVVHHCGRGEHAIGAPHRGSFVRRQYNYRGGVVKNTIFTCF